MSELMPVMAHESSVLGSTANLGAQLPNRVNRGNDDQSAKCPALAPKADVDQNDCDVR
jgi:hypothetical protein